jgi:hypothetical protein
MVGSVSEFPERGAGAALMAAGLTVEGSERARRWREGCIYAARGWPLVGGGVGMSAGSLCVCDMHRQRTGTVVTVAGLAALVSPACRQVPKLKQLQQSAAANGVTDLQLLSRQEAQALEPALSAAAALLSPSTGVCETCRAAGWAGGSCWRGRSCAAAPLLMRLPACWIPHILCPLLFCRLSPSHPPRPPPHTLTNKPTCTCVCTHTTPLTPCRHP